MGARMLVYAHLTSLCRSITYASIAHNTHYVKCFVQRSINTQECGLAARGMHPPGGIQAREIKHLGHPPPPEIAPPLPLRIHPHIENPHFSWTA